MSHSSRTDEPRYSDPTYPEPPQRQDEDAAYERFRDNNPDWSPADIEALDEFKMTGEFRWRKGFGYDPVRDEVKAVMAIYGEVMEAK